MVEIQDISINDLIKNKDGDFDNEIILSPIKQENSKNLASESEFHRIMIHLNGKHEKSLSGYDIAPDYFTLNVGKNVKRYEELIKKNGELFIKRMQYVLDEADEKILDDEKHYKLSEIDIRKYVYTFCGAGHSRTQKNLFVLEDVADKLNDILLCGMDKDMTYDRPSKWNAYYAMATTDSTPVTYMPNIVVIPDYVKKLTDIVDIVLTSGTGNNKKYTPIQNQVRDDIEIMPFDGAGLVTPECALKWARELKCISEVGKFYLPSCFQFRAIPGIKGELMVFDLKQFAKEHKVSKIKDLGGKVWDIFKDNIDVVLTQSQFKFWKQFTTDGKFDYCKWRNEFDKPCHGYKRTFNIVSYGSHLKDLRKRTMLSYQPLESINFTAQEVEKVSEFGIDLYKRVSTNISEFLKYRGLVNCDDNGQTKDLTDRYTPPFYKALLKNNELFYDRYIREKVDADIQKLKNNLLSGKQIVHGNYQVFMPDLYGFAEWIFHDELKKEPVGLLTSPFDIYSDWWNSQCVRKVDIIRNPHIGMEHRIGNLRNNRKLKKWFKYQSTGIVTGMYDTLAMALGTADFDGDNVCTTDNEQILNAVKREMDKGNGRLVIKEIKDDLELGAKPSGVKVSDRSALMKINAMSFKNSIGTVIDKITNLWSMINLDEKVRNYIKIGVIVGEETIDFAKTGENAAFPSDMVGFLKGRKKGHWMRYLEKNRSDAAKEEKSIENARFLKKDKLTIDKLKKFEKYDCNMNNLCLYAEKQIALIDANIETKATDKAYDYKLMLRSDPSINRNVYRKLKVLQKEYNEISNNYRKEAVKSKTQKRDAVSKFRWFYEKCRNELLYIVPDINSLLDMLIIIYYGAKHNGSDFIDLEKDILWNAFSKEMIQRCTGGTIKEIDFSKIEQRNKKNNEYIKKQKESKTNKRSVFISSLEDYTEREVVLTIGDRVEINRIIDKAYEAKKITRKDNVIKLKRVLSILIFLSRKCETEKTECRALKENGHFVKDSNKLNKKVPVKVFHPIWLKKYNNAPGQLTDTAIEKLTDVNHKSIDSAIKLFEELEVIQTKVCSDGNIEVKVLFPHYDGAEWVKELDYNKAGTRIRDYFRK
jgi:hypothetical protein